MGFLTKVRSMIAELREMPRLRVNLMLTAAEAGNDPFYAQMVRTHYRQAMRRHRKYWVVRQGVHGVAMCPLPETFDKYYYVIEASARRNHKKAMREGCTVERINYNDHLEGIREVWQSAEERQGRLMPEEYRKGQVKPCTNPPSRSPLHDYAYFGVFLKGKMIGYCGCLIAGEFCGVENILGHADHLPLGPVPLLFIGVAEYLYKSHPQVKYYGYGTYFGAGETMRRFKKKFGFVPHRVEWVLDNGGGAKSATTVTPPLMATGPMSAEQNRSPGAERGAA